MKPYGVRKADRGCCPGHDKYPHEDYRIRRSNPGIKRRDKHAKTAARARARIAINNALYSEV